MSEHLQRTCAICATIDIVGLVFSWVLWVSLVKFNRNFELKDFYDRSDTSTSTFTNDAYQTIRLNDRQFLVSSRGGSIDVYQVDAKGNISRISSTR